jgi:hypothetical protein
MKDTRNIIIIFLSCAIALYLMIGYVSLEFNILSWDNGLRAMHLILSIIFAMFGIGVYFHDKADAL